MFQKSGGVPYTRPLYSYNNLNKIYCQEKVIHRLSTGYPQFIPEQKLSYPQH